MHPLVYWFLSSRQQRLDRAFHYLAILALLLIFGSVLIF